MHGISRTIKTSFNMFSSLRKSASVEKLKMDEEFVRPPEAPIFNPTEDEFRDPLAYINKIKTLVGQVGIFRVVPPAKWKPSFALDMEKAKFTATVQKLNQLEPLTKIKLDFQDNIISFWEMQGGKVIIPKYDGKSLDMYSLYKIVKEEGSRVLTKKQWLKVEDKMGLSEKKPPMSPILKYYYEKFIHPFDIFLEICILNEKKGVIKNINSCNELQCRICECLADSKDQLIVCFNCKVGYHKLCLKIAPPAVLRGPWRCVECVSEEFSRQGKRYALDETSTEYSLAQFKTMSDAFKTWYFKQSEKPITLKFVEAEYWKILSSLDQTQTVEYGFDLGSTDLGSGFPTKDSTDVNDPEIMKYINSPWNLNNFPCLDGSFFGLLPGKIKGINTPSLHIGMCFATSCWHVNEHWSYSINYLHSGAPKTWYGIPANFSFEFERTMKNVASELFEIHSDLLDRRTTMLNPTEIIKNKISIYRTDQSAGEFVITFPRAYHSGFSHGYNCAEEINFGTADWLIFGRECNKHYSFIQRRPLFSHDELICRIAFDVANIDPRIAAATFQDLLKVVKEEREKRLRMYAWGIREVKRVVFDYLSDEPRQCDFCKSFCFFSVISCACKQTVVCLGHYKKLCTDCPPDKHLLKYAYHLNELPPILQRLKIKAETFDQWMYSLNSCLKYGEFHRSNLSQLKKLLKEARENNFPETVIERVMKSIEKIEKKK